jgi:hypothetical protein
MQVHFCKVKLVRNQYELKLNLLDNFYFRHPSPYFIQLLEVLKLKCVNQ